MNKFNIVNNGIIGSDKALTKLAKSEKAKLLLVSDTHNHKADLEATILRYGKTVDALIFAGDGVDDILYCLSVALYDSELKNALPDIIAVVAGNCDSLKYRMNLEPNSTTKTKQKNPEALIELPETLVLKVCSQNIFLTHGHLCFININTDEIIKVAQTKNCNIIIHGHTHMQTEKNIGNQKIFNPGSLTNPRNSSFAGFGILELTDTASANIEFIPYFRK